MILICSINICNDKGDAALQCKNILQIVEKLSHLYATELQKDYLRNLMMSRISYLLFRGK